MRVGSAVGDLKYPNNWPRIGGVKHHCGDETSALTGSLENKDTTDNIIKRFLAISSEELISPLFVYEISIDIISKFYIHTDMEMATFFDGFLEKATMPA